ncbi:MAG: hypothetical protein DRJ96_08315 [Thermoprotei archaeon]|nr:MAG: hypothetical protein DRJ96_08315 [Thermoprotei archaeon]
MMELHLATAASAPIVLLVSLVYEGVDRKLRARMQGRVGPPLLQPFYDLVKLFSKDRIIPFTAAYPLFNYAPLLSASCALAGGALVFVVLVTGLQLAGDLLLVFYLLSSSSLLAMVGGASSGNPYAAISLSRGLSVLLSYKLPMLLSVLTAAIKAGGTLSLASVIALQAEAGGGIATLSLGGALALLAFMLCMPAEGEVPPFDVTTAKTEVVHGFLIEYGGPHLALVKIAKGVSRFSTALLAASLFLYTPARPPLAAMLCLLEAMCIAVLTITVPGTVLGRVKPSQVVRFCLVAPTSIAILSLAISLLEAGGLA